MDDFASLVRQRTCLSLNIDDIFFSYFVCRKRHKTFVAERGHMLTRNAHIDIAHIDTSNRFKRMDGLLQRFHNGIVFV